MRPRKEDEKVEILCPFNKAIACETQDHCEKCAWNPEYDRELTIILRKQRTCMRHDCHLESIVQKKDGEHAMIKCAKCGKRFDIPPMDK